MSAELGNAPEPVGWVCNRNFIVPPDIIPVRRVSPIPKKKRTPCRARPEGEPICRAGDREWFGDQLFADGETPDLRTACATSMTMHASCVIGALILLAGHAASTTPVAVSSPLRMPAFVALSGGGAGDSAPPLRMAALAPMAPLAKPVVVTSRPPRRSSAKAPDLAPAVAEPLPEASADSEDASVRSEDESTEDAKANAEISTDVGVPNGTPDGVAASGETSEGGGNGDGQGGGAGAAGPGTGSAGLAMSPGPYRLGAGIEPPKKIKHVAPIYPAAALASRALGTVVIEAVVGADGRIHDAKVVHSVALLDQAALEAVRRWEFAPSRLNGVAVAVIVTVLVQFAMY